MASQGHSGGGKVMFTCPERKITKEMIEDLCREARDTYCHSCGGTNKKGYVFTEENRRATVIYMAGMSHRPRYEWYSDWKVKCIGCGFAALAMYNDGPQKDYEDIYNYISDYMEEMR